MELKSIFDPLPTPNVLKKSRLAEAGAAAEPSRKPKPNPNVKRTLTAASFLPPSGELPEQPYLTISSTDANRKITDLNLFKTGDALRQALGYIPTNVQKLSSGELLVKCVSEKEVAELLKITSFGGIPCVSARHVKFNRSKGVVRNHELKGCSIEEIVANCEGVVEARRITVRRGETTIETNTVVLTFDSCRPPATVRASYLVLEVRPYVPNPLRCFKCQKFGHSQLRCRHAAVCARCGKTGHPEKDCKASPCCPNCQGQHTAFSKECQTWLRERAIQEYKAKHGCSFQEARKTVGPPAATPVAGRSYATAARTVLSATSTSKGEQSEPKVNRRNNNKKIQSVPVAPTFKVPLSNRFSPLEEEGVDSSSTPTPPTPSSSPPSSAPPSPPPPPLMAQRVPPRSSSQPPPPPSPSPAPENIPLPMEEDPPLSPRPRSLPGETGARPSPPQSPSRLPPDKGRQSRKTSVSPSGRRRNTSKPGPLSSKLKNKN